MIRSITIPAAVAELHGLESVRLRGLGQVVVLAGPNGAGKSRYLAAVRETVRQVDDAANRRDREIAEQQEIEGYVERLSQVVGPGSPVLLPRPGSIPLKASLAEQHEATQTELAAVEHRVRSTDETLGLIDLEPPARRGAATRVTWLPLPPTAKEISEVDELTPKQRDEQLSRLSERGYGDAYRNMSPFLAQIANALWMSDHPNEKEKPEVQDRARDAHAFSDIVRTLLGAGIEPEAKGTGDIRARFRGRSFNRAEPSSGEKVLLAWAIALHRQRASFADAIVLIDEPENHLHPAACIQVLERLRTLLGPQGQIWLATHSVPLIAYGGFESVYLVKDNRATFARDKIDQVVESLLGGEDGRHRLLGMLTDADAFGAARFLAECLTAPAPVDTGPEDPQAALLRSHLADSDTTPLRVLDYGAGRGRLARALVEGAHQPPSLDYFAFNRPEHTAAKDAEACLSNLRLLCPESGPQTRYWTSIPELRAQVGCTFDRVVLCNVLHEIPPTDWLTLAVDVASVLKPNGILLIMEDLLPPIGELPHGVGYLMLDQFGLKTLFRVSEEVVVRSAREGRLIAVEIPGGSVGQMTPQSRIDTLIYVRDQARGKLTELRGSTANRGDARLGRQAAHYTIQFANASLALDQFHP